MYRVAVIQNEVEMQHSGYVDSVPKYREKFDFDSDVFFNRFSSVNIHKIFREGEDYLLDYDCLIIGTNATSDGDVYKVLQKQGNKKLLSDFIQQGKGVLICSQKKLISDDTYEGYSVRKTNFLPDDYEYNVISRPADESSADGNVHLASFEYNNIQSYILSVPHTITNGIIEKHCTNNDFQTHFYRDYIDPKKESAYFSLLLDKGTPIRNTLMVASPKNNEKIVISTMALDWAGHYELLENIIHYLMVGIPEVAFVTKTSASEAVFKFLVSEAQLAKISYKTYNSTDAIDQRKLSQYHSLFVFSPAYSEGEVSDFWDTIKSNMEYKYTRLFHYRHINDDPTKDLILVNFSQNRQIDSQKQAVATWLISLYEDHLWDNSLWKTYDVILAFKRLDVSIKPYIAGIFKDINGHYKDGSYDGVLAPTCGLLEILNLIKTNDNYASELPNIKEMLKETIAWLIAKYTNTSNYNKKFIVRAFHRAGLMPALIKSFPDSNNFLSDLYGIATTDTVAIEAKSEVALCLDIEICIIYNKCSQTDEQIIKKMIKDCLAKLLKGQMQTGRWDDNLGKTARILLFLMEYELKLPADKREMVGKAIESGIIALRKDITRTNKNNWEKNIVTTANAISALVLSDGRAKYESKDFLSQISYEVKLSSSYNSLSLALSTLGRVLGSYNDSQLELKSLRKTKEQYDKDQIKIYVLVNVATISILLLISYYIFLWLENEILFRKLLYESFMWIPITAGIVIAAIIGVVPKVIGKVPRVIETLFDKKD